MHSSICEWVKLSWDTVSEDMVKKSFLSCAITVPTDGSNDSAIHCFKEHHPCAQGKDLFKKRMEKLLAADAIGSPTDPFASDCDSGEEGSNEILIDDEEDSSSGNGSDKDESEDNPEDDEDEDECDDEVE